MAQSDLTVHSRTESGKGATRRLRAQGLIPAVFYGAGVDTVPLAVSPRALRKAIATDSGMNTLLKLDVADGGDAGVSGKVAIIKELQCDPVTNRELHADFMLIDLSKTLQVEVPIHCVGTAAGVIDGGIMEQIRREVLVECLPDRIPNEITVDVSELTIGDAIHVEDLPAAEGVEYPHDVNFTIVTIVAPAQEEEEVPPEELLEGEEAAAAEAAGEEGAAEDTASDGGGEE